MKEERKGLLNHMFRKKGNLGVENFRKAGKEEQITLLAKELAE